MSQLKLAQQKFVDSKEAVKKLRDKKGRAMNVGPALVQLPCKVDTKSYAKSSELKTQGSTSTSCQIKIL